MPVAVAHGTQARKHPVDGTHQFGRHRPRGGHIALRQRQKIGEQFGQMRRVAADMGTVWQDLALELEFELPGNALLAALGLIALTVLVTNSNKQRDEALAAQRRSFGTMRNAPSSPSATPPIMSSAAMKRPCVETGTESP